MMGNTLKKKSSGFTIVELLIVIVVIAILAAISIVSYTGIQQRANNTAIISAASQSFNMIQAYIAANGSYPAMTSSCITTTTTCQANSSAPTLTGPDAGFTTQMATMGSLPKEVPASGTQLFGVMYLWNATATLDGKSTPATLLYYLFGANQQCKLNGVVNNTPPYTLSASGYTIGNDAGHNKTLCRIIIPGPSA